MALFVDVVVDGEFWTVTKACDAVFEEARVEFAFREIRRFCDDGEFVGVSRERLDRLCDGIPEGNVDERVGVRGA